jgi:hypothetical protein
MVGVGGSSPLPPTKRQPQGSVWISGAFFLARLTVPHATRPCASLGQRPGDRRAIRWPRTEAGVAGPLLDAVSAAGANRSGCGQREPRLCCSGSARGRPVSPEIAAEHMADCRDMEALIEPLDSSQACVDHIINLPQPFWSARPGIFDAAQDLARAVAARRAAAVNLDQLKVFASER